MVGLDPGEERAEQGREEPGYGVGLQLTELVEAVTIGDPNAGSFVLREEGVAGHLASVDAGHRAVHV